jgi:hypothetical protein
MATNVRSFMPLRSFMGQTVDVRHGRMTAGESFGRGEPVRVVDAGTVTEFPTDATSAVITDMDSGALGGIAMNGPGDGLKDIATGLSYAALADIFYIPFGSNVRFITTQYNSAVGTAAIPPGTIIGESFMIKYSAGLVAWVLDGATNGVYGTDVLFRVEQVLDALGRPIAPTDTTTGVFVVGPIIATP